MSVNHWLYAVVHEFVAEGLPSKLIEMTSALVFVYLNAILYMLSSATFSLCIVFMTNGF